MNPVNWARFGLLAALWGCSFAFIKVSLDAFAPLQLAFGRLLVGALVVALILTVTKGSFPQRAVWGHIAVASVFGNVVPFTLFAVGEQHTTATIAGVIQGATPLVTLGLAAVAIRTEKPTARKVTGLVIGFVGLIVVVGPWRTHGFGSIGGQLACVGAAVSYAVSFVYLRRFIAPYKIPALAVTAAQLTCAMVITGLITTFSIGWDLPGELTAGPLLSLLVLGGASTGIAFVLMNRLIADAGPTTASGVNYLVPVFSVAVGAVALGESITWNVPVGGAVVIAALALAEGRLPLPARRGADGEAGASAAAPAAAASAPPAPAPAASDRAQGAVAREAC
ncbi:DMT family transporter [Streptomyces apricus]|uniref:DMT family transporter n=1 Tax=Streptomyces apricus TaxID=1828112 RepID=A0A5B0AF52_9ACTN|nr:DMT family transporter [Streptomyces apricus]KAA0928603.1 DMT family transporter [Streptomyces apricus]